jgi:hypothetical protein
MKTFYYFPLARAEAKSDLKITAWKLVLWIRREMKLSSSLCPPLLCFGFQEETIENDISIAIHNFICSSSPRLLKVFLCLSNEKAEFLRFQKVRLSSTLAACDSFVLCGNVSNVFLSSRKLKKIRFVRLFGININRETDSRASGWAKWFLRANFIITGSALLLLTGENKKEEAEAKIL